jgi:hypothetical protein
MPHYKPLPINESLTKQMIALALLAVYALANSPDMACNMDNSKKLKCKLSSKPDEPIQVFFQSADLVFDDCSVTFNDADWKSVPATVLPSFHNSDGTETVKINVRYSSGCSVQNQEITLQKTIKKYCYGSSFGDPYIQTFNDEHSKIDAMGVGYFDLLSHKDIQIQTKQVACRERLPGDHSCNFAVSVRYRNEVVALDISTNSQAKVTRIVDGDKKIKFDEIKNFQSTDVDFLVVLKL